MRPSTTSRASPPKSADHNPPVTRSGPYAKPLLIHVPTSYTATQEPGWRVENSIADAYSVRVSVRQCPCWVSHDASPPMMHAPHAVTKLHTHETGCESEASFSSSGFGRTRDTAVDRRFIYSDLSQIHSFDDGISSVVVESWETGRLTMQIHTRPKTRETQRQRIRKP